MTASHAQGLRLHQAGKLHEAEAEYLKVLEHEPANEHALQLLGVINIERKQFEKAVELIERAIAINPKVAVYHHNIAAGYRVLGAFDRAEHHYQCAIRLQPDYAEAYFNYVATRRFSADEPVFEAIAAQLSRTELSTDERCFLEFAAGKIHDDVGNYDQAFAHYAKGNNARQAEFDFDAHERLLEETISVFDRDTLATRVTEGNDSALPVFVVGMPRSGTTLVEQILASHSLVHGAGELNDIGDIARTLSEHTTNGTAYPTCVQTLDGKVMHGFGDAYVRRIRTLSQRSLRIVDKMPVNYLYLGLVALLLPNARIIHCRRDPLDTCLSCYFQRFRRGQDYSYDLNHLGRYYTMYRQLMDYWTDTLPLPIFDIDYEALVAEPETVARELIAFCGLKWDERCLEFHRIDRNVTTASNWQVRQPVYRSAVGRWRNYEAHLNPLRAALGATLAP